MTTGDVLPEMTAGTLSPDRGFYWDGAQWVSALGGDGYWTWNGAAWVPTESLSGPGSFHPYISPRDLGRAATILLAISGAIAVVEALFLNDFVAFDGVRFSYSVGFGGVLVFTVTAAVFLGWFHRSYRNLAALGAQGRQLTPGWAVGWWFIPVACLWKPHGATQEMWRAGDPSTFASSNLIRLWWTAWLVSLVLFNVSAFSGLADIVSWQGALSAQATVLAAVLAILVVRSVSARQDERWRNVSAVDVGQLPDRSGESSGKDAAP